VENDHIAPLWLLEKVCGLIYNDEVIGGESRLHTGAIHMIALYGKVDDDKDEKRKHQGLNDFPYEM
jgi:hypothetical protein